jgi:hypothetical protein
MNERRELYRMHNGWLIAFYSFIYIFSACWLQSTIIELRNRAGVLSLAMAPVGLLLRVTAVAFCLLAGVLLTDRKLSFGAAFKIALFAESAPAGFAVLKLLLLAFFHPVTRLQDLQAFAPLSLYSIPGASSFARWWTYPLQTMNVFEVAYWFLLAVGLRHYLGRPLGRMLLLVLGSYGLGLVCWMAGVEFLVINFM